MVVVERDRPARVRERDIGTVAGAAGTVVLVPGPVDGGLERVSAGREVRDRQLPDVVLEIARHLRLVAPRGPVLGCTGRGHAAELAVEAAGSRDRIRLLDGAAATAATRRRRCGHAGDRRRCRHAQVAVVLDDDRAVLDRRAGRDAADVVEHAVRSVVIGAEHLPLGCTDRAPGEGHLVETAARHGNPELGAVVDRGTGAGVRKTGAGAALVFLSWRRGLPHDRGQRRHGYRNPALAVALDLRSAGRPDALECHALAERVERDGLRRSALFVATTYSTLSSASIRLNAKTPASLLA